MMNLQDEHHYAGADLRLCGAPGWNLEGGPFYIYSIKLSLIEKKINEWIEVFVLLK